MNIQGWLLTALLVANPQFAMSDTLNGQLWTCHIPEKQLTVLDAPKTHVLNGREVILYRFARKGGTQQDMMLIYETRSGKPLPFPHYYIYDMDGDSMPDKAYADMQGNGICGQMQEVPVEMALGKGEKGA